MTRVSTLEATDYIRVYYSLDGGAETLLTNGDQTGTFANPQVASATGLNGTTLAIIVRVNNDENNEYHRFDNVKIYDY